MLRNLQERMLPVLERHNVPHRIIRPNETMTDFFEVELTDEQKHWEPVRKEHETYSHLWHLLSTPLT